MPLVTASAPLDIPLEQLAGSVERVTLHSEETGFCMVRGTPEVIEAKLATVVTERVPHDLASTRSATCRC